MSFGKVHFEESADARGERVEIVADCAASRSGAAAITLAACVGGVNRGAVFGEYAGLGEDVEVRQAGRRSREFHSRAAR